MRLLINLYVSFTKASSAVELALVDTEGIVAWSLRRCAECLEYTSVENLRFAASGLS